MSRSLADIEFEDNVDSDRSTPSSKAAFVARATAALSNGNRPEEEVKPFAGPGRHKEGPPLSRCQTFHFPFWRDYIVPVMRSVARLRWHPRRACPYSNSSSSTFASFKGGASKPSVRGQQLTGFRVLALIAPEARCPSNDRGLLRSGQSLSSMPANGGEQTGTAYWN
jgi:hypothetical protein